eukprot:1152321-Pelagomonas_calceolata.AAC.8
MESVLHTMSKHNHGGSNCFGSNGQCNYTRGSCSGFPQIGICNTYPRVSMTSEGSVASSAEKIGKAKL